MEEEKKRRDMCVEMFLDALMISVSRGTPKVTYLKLEPY